MATIKVKKTASTAPASLGYGELGIANNEFYFGNSSNTPIKLVRSGELGTAAYTASTAYAASGHTTSSDHDGRYYTETEVDAKIYLKSHTDNRSVVTVPNDYNSKFEIKGLKTNSVIGITGGGTYSALLGIRGWTDSSGGNSHELAFDGNGEIFHRHGATTTWNAWDKLAKQSWVTGLGYTTNSGVTSIETSGAISGGTITSTGTISHLDTAGYKHIPTGGATGQILRYSASGTATWYTPPWTTYSAGTGLTLSGTTFSFTAPESSTLANYLIGFSATNAASQPRLDSRIYTLDGVYHSEGMKIHSPSSTFAMYLSGSGSDFSISSGVDGNLTISAYGSLKLSTSYGPVYVNSDRFQIRGTSTGGVVFATANTSTTNYTATFPNVSGTVALQSWVTGLNYTTSSGVTSVSLASGTNNGTLKLTVNGSTTDNIAVKGLGNMAYEDSASYLLLNGGTMSGTLNMNSNTISSVTDITNGSTGFNLSAYGNISIIPYGHLNLVPTAGKVIVNSNKFKINGSGTGGILLATTNSSATDYTATLQAGSGTIAYLSDIPASWKIVRSRSAATALTSVSSGNTVGSVTLTESVSQGDVLAIEVNYSSAATAIPNIITVTVGRISTAPNTSEGYGSGWVANYSSTGVAWYSFALSASGTTLYFNYKNVTRIVPGSTTAITRAAMNLYVGKVWKIG